MNRLLILFVVCLLALPVFGEPDRQLHEKCLYPSVYITVEGMNGTVGSGVILRSENVNGEYHNVALTCAHVVEKNYSYIINRRSYVNWSTPNKRESYACIVHDVNAETDMALLLFKSKERLPVVDVDMNPDVYIGNDVFKFGSGQTDEPRLDIGKITSLKNRNKIRTSIQTIRGDSGSPVFFDYKMIGVATSIDTTNDPAQKQLIFHISYVSPIVNLKKFATFSYDKNVAIPKMPFLFMEFHNLKINKNIMPITPWGR